MEYFSAPTFQVKRRNPKSNAERQRQFRLRNPDYYRQLHAQRRAGVKALGRQLIALAQASAQLEAQVKVPVKQILMLPAPAELSVYALNIPIKQRELVAIERTATA